MIRALYTAVSGLITQEAKQNVITNNLANVSTTGFKSNNLVVSKFNDVLIQNSDKLVNGKNVKNVIGSISQGSQIDEVTTDFSDGTMQSTSLDTDFAISGKGFFTVTRNNQDYYSKDGHFHVDNQGYLANDNGDRVKGTNVNTNMTDNIFVGSGKLSSDGSGQISIDGKHNYNFNIASFDNLKSLKDIGDNLYTGTNPKQATGITVNQGSLEASNVDVMTEIVNMMTVMRTYETNQKLVQYLDQTLAKTVNEVGAVR